MDPIVLRCSRLPIAAACTASLVPPAVAIESNGPEARAGTAMHRVLSERIAGHDLEAAEAARDEDVDPEEVEMLVGMAWRSWQKAQEWYPGALTEQYCERNIPVESGRRPVKLTGHIDLISEATPDEIRVLDWKSGHLDEDHWQQLRGYGFLALCAYPEHEYVYAAILRVRSGTVDGQRFSRAELERWAEDLAERVQTQTVYSPGMVCRYCPRRFECPAREQWLSGQAAALLGRDFSSEVIAGLLGDELVELHERRKLLAGVCEQVNEAIRSEVAARGGLIQLSDGRELRLSRQERKSLEFARGWPVLLESGLSHQDLAGCASLSKTKVEDAVRKSSPRGEKKGAVERVLSSLDAAGALVTNTIERLEIAKATAAITHEVTP